MLHSVGSLLSIIANRSNGLEKIFSEGLANLETAPIGFLELTKDREIFGCFNLPYLGSDLQKRSWLSTFIFGYKMKHSCWFGYGPMGIALYVDDQRQRFIDTSNILKIKTNVWDGSLIVLRFKSPKIQTIHLKFGEASSAIKICKELKILLFSKT